VSEHNSSDHTSVGLIDIASQVPGLLAGRPGDSPRGGHRLLARPTSKTSIGKVFQDRAARLGDKVFLRFGDQQLTYREANATANRYAAVLAARGVGRGDVVGVMLRKLTQRRADDAGRGQVRRDRRHAELPPARRCAGAQPGSAGREGACRRIRSARGVD